MDNLAANFEITPNNPFNCSFELFATGTVWGSIDGNINNQTDLINLLNTKVDLTSFEELSQTVTNNYNELTGDITDLTTTVTDNYNTLSGQISDLTTTVNNNYTSLDNRLITAEQGVLDLTDVINTYGDVVTYDASDFATKNQGLLANTALQPNDNITELVNNAGFITSADLPTVNNNTITLQKNGTNIDSFTLNQNTNKSINITVPTNTNELTNGAGFITNAVNDLTNYYLKSETYTKTEVQQLIASIPQFSVEVVQSLPVTGERMVLYLVPKQGEAPDVYNEYIWVEDEDEFELLGSTAVDLDGYATELWVQNQGYATETYVDNGLATKVSKSGDNLTGTLTTNSAIYLTNISSSVHTSVSRIYFGSVSSPTNYISANGAGAFGIYNNARQGITCYPTQNLFPDATSGTIDLGRSNNKWKNLYISGTLYGANTNISITDLISGATAGNTAVQPADLPVVNDATITFTQGGTTKGTITLNQSNNQTISLDAGGGGAVDSVNGQTGTVVLTANDIGALPDSTTIPAMTSQLTNDSGYITNSALNGYATQSWVGQQGYITGITSSDVTTALGYTPYNATNPNGYTSNVGTVTSVNNTQPDSNGNVTITIPDTATWGNISGTLSDQTDLQNALNAKLNVSDVTEYTAAEVETLWGSI